MAKSKPPKASISGQSKRVIGIAGAAGRAGAKAQGILGKIKAKISGITKPVGRARASQVDRQIGIDVERRPVGETFKKGRSTTRLAPEVELARKRRGKR